MKKYLCRFWHAPICDENDTSRQVFTGSHSIEQSLLRSFVMKQLSFIKRSNGSHWVGNGFPVQNIFSYNDIAEKISPFLMMDHAGPTIFPPTHQKLGVGQHPHRGFETVTIVYQGGVSHRDSSGGGGTIGPGDVQWMTAASGLIHEEFHSEAYARQGGPFEMIQLWVNLPAKDKMSTPGYQGITADNITNVALANDAGIARIIAGTFENVRGAAQTFTPMNVWDLRLNAGRTLSLSLPSGHTTALYVLSGALNSAHTRFKRLKWRSWSAREMRSRWKLLKMLLYCSSLESRSMKELSATVLL
jgi:redox-sensitive bicupin YhaK (pirin superfamily)